MCGIAGKVSARGPVNRTLVERMCAAQEHRGPDALGVHIGEGVGLGIQRLRVIDLATGDQPIYNEDRSVSVVLNGEIYNFRELRRRLQERGHQFATAGDTEVIVHLYEEHGPALVEHLHGMFAFALWDETHRRLVIGRDRVGKKPLFYSESDKALTFASELAALTQGLAVGREIDLDSLDCYLALGYVPAPYSIWRDVRKLSPASVLVWEDGKSSIRRYWELDYEPKIEGGLPDLEGELRARIAAAVQGRMIADVPLGAFLSGGVDSSIVVSEMAFASSAPVKTFSIGFGQEQYSELPKARLVAERFGTDHTELTVEPDAISIMPKLIRHYGEPFADSSSIPSFYLAELTRKHVTVALNGDGGDESFAGYRRHIAAALSGPVDRLPAGLRKRVAEPVASRLPAAGRGSAIDYARRYLKAAASDGASRYGQYFSFFSPERRRKVLAPGVRDAIDGRRAADTIAGPWQAAAQLSALDRVLAVDAKTYLPGDLLPKVDIATMAYSLEARSPLLDASVMEFAAALPARYKLHRGQKKWIIRHAYSDRLPDEILSGPKKGFGVPIAEWLREDLRDWTREMLLSPEARDNGLTAPAEVERLVDEHQSGRAEHADRIWALLCLEGWRREFAA